MADDQQFSAQDLEDLRQIRQQLPADHPKAGALDSLLQSQGAGTPNKGLAPPAASGINPKSQGMDMLDTTLNQSAGPALALGEKLKSNLHSAASPVRDADLLFHTAQPTLAQAQSAAMPLSQSASMAIPGMAGKEAIRAVKAIPTPAEVGLRLGAVEDAAKAAGQTVTPSSETMNAIDRAKEINKSAGTTLPSPMRTFAKNLAPSAKNPGPIAPPTFQAARDAYVPSTKLTAEDSMKLTGPMRSVNAKFARALDSDIRSAAQAIGQGENYAQAMKDYPLALRWQGLKDAAPGVLAKVGKFGIAALGGGALGGLGFEIAREFKEK